MEKNTETLGMFERFFCFTMPKGYDVILKHLSWDKDKLRLVFTRRGGKATVGPLIERVRGKGIFKNSFEILLTHLSGCIVTRFNEKRLEVGVRKILEEGGVIELVQVDSELEIHVFSQS